MPQFTRCCSAWDCQHSQTKVQVDHDFCIKTYQARCTHEELAGFGASWFKDVGDKWYCSHCLNMAHNEKHMVKFRNKQDSHLLATCTACASATVVTHEPNMTLVRSDYAVCHLSTMAAHGLLRQQPPACVPKPPPPVRATLLPVPEPPLQEPPPHGGCANAIEQWECLHQCLVDASSSSRS